MKRRVALCWAALAAACAHASLDRGTARGSHEEGVRVSEVPVEGATVYVDWGQPPAVKQGELIAVDAGYVYVNAGGGWANPTPIPRETIKSVSVEVHPSDSSEVGGWTVFGCLSTVSHGYYVVFTGPLWLVTGISAAVAESVNATAEAGPDQLDQLYQYARFPQGMPRRVVPVGPPVPAAPPPAIAPRPPISVPAEARDAGPVSAPPT